MDGPELHVPIRTLRWGATVALAATVACFDTGPQVVSIEITPALDTLTAIEATLQLQAMARDADGRAVEGVTFTWRSVNPGIAHVDAQGLVTAVSDGEVQVTASAEDLLGTMTLTVIQAGTRLAVHPIASVAAGAAISPMIVVDVLDANGHPTAASTAAVTLDLETNPTGSAIAGAVTAQAVRGRASFADLRVERPGSGYVLRASSPGMTAGLSNPFDVEIRFLSLSTGGAMTCGLLPSKEAYCWGRNQTGGLGIGSAGGDRNRPTLVAGGLRFGMIDVGATSNIGGMFDGFACGVTADWAAYCWGRNDHGQLGDGDAGVSKSYPVSVTGGLAFASISAGRDHACGIALDERAYCWGGNMSGQLGDDNYPVDADVPTLVTGDLRWRSINADIASTCGITTDGSLYCWPSASFLPGSYIVDHPTKVTETKGFTVVDQGMVHACARDGTGFAYCWGQDLYGNLGLGTIGTNAHYPMIVGGGDLWWSVGAGGATSCGHSLFDGMAYCWGRLPSGDTPWPTLVQGSPVFGSLAVGEETYCGVTPAGIGYCWGLGNDGQRGDGTFTTTVTAPVRIVNP